MRVYAGSADFKSRFSKECFSPHSEACVNIKTRKVFFSSFFAFYGIYLSTWILADSIVVITL